MPIPYERTGRTAQKLRTRDAILAATDELLAEGRMPTVEEAAAAASVSRTTAYRYFPNQRALLAASHPETEADSLLGENPPENVAQRLEITIAGLIRLTLEYEPQLRAALRVSLEPADDGVQELALRRGRALVWIEEALSPLQGQIPADELRRLALAVRSASGIEALIWLTDVARLSREQAAEQMRWTALRLFDAARAGAAAAS